MSAAGPLVLSKLWNPFHTYGANSTTWMTGKGKDGNDINGLRCGTPVASIENAFEPPR
jgi:hypothetical protein